MDAQHHREVTPPRARNTMTDISRIDLDQLQRLTLEELRAELAPIKARADALPFITRQLETIRQELRQLKAACVPKG
jgi:hypothetical protein